MFPFDTGGILLGENGSKEKLFHVCGVFDGDYVRNVLGAGDEVPFHFDYWCSRAGIV